MSLVFAKDDGTVIIWEMAVILNVTAHATTPVVTALRHGFSNGDVVAFSEIDGDMGTDVLNGNSYTVANKTDDTFEISETVDTSGKTYNYGGILKKSVSTGMTFVQDVRFSENLNQRVIPNMGADYNRFATIQKTGTLDVGRLHSSYALDIGIASDTDKLYFFELEFTEFYNRGITESYELRHCSPSNRSNTAGQLNAISRKWLVGKWNLKE